MIPKEKNHYNNTPEDFALIDNKLSASQLAIGESSNLAQLSLSYTYNFDDIKYDNYVCILSVIAQAAIDNAKRTFDINIPEEIKRIKEDMNIIENKYPSFFLAIRPDFNKSRINKELTCPMNYIYNISLGKFRDSRPTISNSEFFVGYDIGKDRRKSKKVEDLIEKYSLKLYLYRSEDKDDSEYIVLRHDFDKLIEDIKKVNISSNYQGMMSWLINRAFMMTPNIQSNAGTISTTLNKNRAVLLKVLYSINPEIFLKCFKNGQKVVKNG